ncbi:Palmitoyl-protein thioesterase 1 [Gurleya vavrai]
MKKNKLNLRDLYDILVVSYHLFLKIENINFVNTQKQILVYGDITGFDFQKFGNFEFTKINDIEQITDFELNIDKIFIFNGTFFKIKRNSIEIYTFLFLLKILYPQNIFINCGINEINFCEQKNNFIYDLGLKYGVKDNEFNLRYSNK